MASSLPRTRKLAGSHRFFKARTNPQPAPWLPSLNVSKILYFLDILNTFLLNNDKKYFYTKTKLQGTLGFFKDNVNICRKKARKSLHFIILCTGPTRPAARTGKPDPTRARKTETRLDPSPHVSGSKPSLITVCQTYICRGNFH